MAVPVLQRCPRTLDKSGDSFVPEVRSSTAKGGLAGFRLASPSFRPPTKLKFPLASYSIMVNPAKRSQATTLKNDRQTVQNFCLPMSTINLKIKLLQLPERGNHLIVIIGGIIDPPIMEQIFRQVMEKIQSLLDCKVLIDLDAADLRFEPADLQVVYALAAALGHRSIKIALVSSPGTDADRLDLLRDSLCRAGLTAALFDDLKSAVTWLSGG
jgi:hypothetical protein